VSHVEHFNRAFSTLVHLVSQMELETRDTSEALAARQCWKGRATCQVGQVAALFVPETGRGRYPRLGERFKFEGLRL